MPKYTVTVVGEITIYEAYEQTFEVEADSEEEAKVLASELAEDEHYGDELNITRTTVEGAEDDEEETEDDDAV